MKYSEVKKNYKWKFLDSLEKYRPDQNKFDRFGNLKEPSKKKQHDLVIKSKYWRKISHILTIGGIHYLEYLVSKKPSHEIYHIVNIIKTPIQKKS